MSFEQCLFKTEIHKDALVVSTMGWGKGREGERGSKQTICRIGVEAVETLDESQRRRQYFP